MDPYDALIIAGFLAVAALVLLWPARGIFWRLLPAFRAAGRVLVEDALKHLHDCEYRNIPGTLQSLSGVLGISGDRAAGLLARLEQSGLVEATEGAVRLTAEGRRYALRVVRTHRLWERYFSDRTSLDPSEWHREAERLEHTTSPEEIDTLAAQMAHPRFDPHGDPIPTAHGDIPPSRGMPLTDLPLGMPARIVHVEDEPEAVHARLLAENLHPGVRVRVLEAGPRQIRFEADAEECVLTPVVAANLSVVPLEKGQEMGGPFERLSGLEPGERARVVNISEDCRPVERRRMLDLGVIPGTVVAAEMRSPSGDPTAYRIRGAVIALRREQADRIRVERLENGGAA